MSVSKNLDLEAELYGKPDREWIGELRQELRLTDEFGIAAAFFVVAIIVGWLSFRKRGME